MKRCYFLIIIFMFRKGGLYQWKVALFYVSVIYSNQFIKLALILVFVSILADYLTGETVLTHLLKRDDIYYYIILAVCVMSCLLLLSIGFLFITQVMMIF